MREEECSGIEPQAEEQKGIPIDANLPLATTKEKAPAEVDLSAPAGEEADPVAILEQCWKACWAEHQGTYCPSWDKREAKLAQELMAKCIEAALEPSTVIELAVSDWSAFMEYAAFKQGAYPIVDVPTLPVLVKWSNSLIWLFLERREEASAATQQVN